MTIQTLINCYSFVHGYDFSTDINQLKLDVGVNQLNSTVFGPSGYTSVIGGLKTWSYNLGGFWQSATSGAVDPEAFPDLGTADRVYTSGADQTAGTAAFLGRGGKFDYSIGGAIGEIMPFSLNCYNTDRYGVVRGQLGAAKGNVSATGALGSGLLLGAVATGQYLYASFHVFTAGTTITVTVQSDDNAGFSSPTTVGTIGPLTTTGGTWMTRVAGPLTDTYYRFTVTAITGTFNVAGAIGIGS